MGFERREDSQQMDYRNDHKLRCERCYGTGRVIGLHEVDAGDVKVSGGYFSDCPTCNGSGLRRS